MNTEHSRSILNALFQLAQSDGNVSDEEKAWLNKLLEDSGLDELPTLDILYFDKLREAIPERDDRERFIQMMLMVSLADGLTSTEELAFIRLVAEELGFTEQELDDFRQNTVLAVDPN